MSTSPILTQRVHLQFLVQFTGVSGKYLMVFLHQPDPSLTPQQWISQVYAEQTETEEDDDRGLNAGYEAELDIPETSEVWTIDTSIQKADFIENKSIISIENTGSHDTSNNNKNDETWFALKKGWYEHLPKRGQMISTDLKKLPKADEDCMERFIRSLETVRQEPISCGEFIPLISLKKGRSFFECCWQAHSD